RQKLIPAVASRRRLQETENEKSPIHFIRDRPFAHRSVDLSNDPVCIPTNRSPTRKNDPPRYPVDRWSPCESDSIPDDIRSRYPEFDRRRVSVLSQIFGRIISGSQYTPVERNRRRLQPSIHVEGSRRTTQADPVNG